MPKVSSICQQSRDSSDYQLSLDSTKNDEYTPPNETPTQNSRNIINLGPKFPIIGAACFARYGPHHLVADLGDYITKTYYDGMPPPQTRPIFDQRIGHFRPQLQNDRINRIILYTGCFNPPHRGHQEVLNLTFSCTQDLNVIAAIVLPISEKGIKKKEYGDRVYFSATQRARLWTGVDGPHEWLWVYDRDGGTSKFRDNLRRNIMRGGFSMEYIQLYGPDHVGQACEPKFRDYIRHIVVCNAGRKADFIHEDGLLAPLSGCESWKELSHLEKRAMPKAKDTADWLLGSLSFTMMKQGELNP
ncbi:uncharacterized protein GGS22DRAFT_184283 [Annulohypoxylon maeteangense]|uniref:uncharacterized protein n=1 Tax=Annulohypoxylon maeteangense TaxID=1927788 RepID=UPI0020082E1A|nr:uncharacterized protein GGS22DRAFT_184283 [Annulohypoxylon maeteangense]KAI0888705.1 hypothetical protein GGS22DRAFT_184283 [Annulohypoxylon maeteangense]